MNQFSLAHWASRLLIIGIIAVLAVGVVLSSAPAPARADGGCVAWHTVQLGENLYRIGLRYGVPYPVIAAANGIGNSNRIFTGQKLCIPAYYGYVGTTTTTTTTTTAQTGTLVVPPYVNILPNLPFYYPLNVPITGKLGHQVDYWPQYGGRWTRDSIRLEPAVQIWTPCQPESVIYAQHLACSKTGLGWFYDFSLVDPTLETS